MDPSKHHRADTRSPDRRHADPHRSRSRSRSPTRHHSSRHGHHHSSGRRSPSPPKNRDRHRDRHRHRRHHHHHRDEKKRTRTPSPAAAAVTAVPSAPVLPFNAPPITKHALALPHVLDVFGNYLDVQKGLMIADLENRETKGRFKRFVHHYNRGELASGWYSLINQEGAPTVAAVAKRDLEVRRPEKKKPRLEEPEQEPEPEEAPEDDESEDEVVGPFLPGQAPKRTVRPGPAIPTEDDLHMQRELLADDASLARADLRFDRKKDREAQREALDELVPRAAAGTHERRLEKKKEVNDKMRAFRDKSPDGEVDDSTLMGGGGEGGTEGFKQKKAALERKKNDRELRKEQLLKARIAEREERLQMHRVKEEKTMAMLKTLATRFQ